MCTARLSTVRLSPLDISTGGVMSLIEQGKGEGVGPMSGTWEVGGIGPMFGSISGNNL